MEKGKSAESRLSKEIIKSHNHLGHSAIEWFSFMIDDCLAGFGKKLETPWDEAHHQHLFTLGGLYGDQVSEHPFKDVLGGVYSELASNYGKKALGQYFTPEPVAKMMATINCKPEDFEKIM